MMTLHSISLLLATTLFALSANATDMTKFAPKVEYSADQTMETADTTMSGKVYVTPTKERREMNVADQTMTMIIRNDKKIGWTLMPDQKMYMEMSFDQANQQAGSMDAYKIETTVMGKETVNGVSCDKSKVIMTRKEDGSKMGGFWWISKDNIVVKMDMLAVNKGDKIRMKLELNNIKIGKQNPSLFEVPAGYSKMSMPNMGNLQDMMKAAESDSAGDAEEAPKSKGGFNLNDAMKMIR